MNQQVNVYYTYCMEKKNWTGDYHKYQRKLADELLNYGLQEMFHVDGTEKRIEKESNGKPFLKGMEQYHFNISNTDGMVVCAVSDMEIGVDAEKKKPFRKGILRKCAGPGEKAYILDAEEKEQQERFFRIWTLKESYIKMTGEGMRIPLNEVEFEILKEEEDIQITCSKEGKFYQKNDKEYWMSLCTKESANVKWIQVNEGR